MNMQRSSRFLATGAVALALIGAGVGASFTDHWGATQPATVAIVGPVLTVNSSTTDAVVDLVAHTVTFAPATITTTDSDAVMGGIPNNFDISSTGTGPISVSAKITGDMPQAELAKFTLADGSPATPHNTFPLGATPVVVATQPSGQPTMYIGFTIDWAGLTEAAQGYTITVTYSIDAA